MSPQEIEKLLGGYATDTLSEDERRNLFEAALENQALFDALAGEQALRELLEDPPSRAHLLAALRERRVSPWARVLAWLRQPSAIALAAAVAAGVVTIAVVIPRKTLEQPTTVAIKQPLAPEPQAIQPQDQRESATVPKPAAAAPAGSPARPRPPRTFDKERDTMLRRDLEAHTVRRAAPAELAPPPVVAVTAEAPPPVSTARPAAPPPPPPPAQTANTTAKSQFQPAEEKQQAQAKVAAAPTPGAAGAASDQPLKKEAASGGARDLYYSTRASTTAFKDSATSASKAKRGAFGRNLSIQPLAARPMIGGVRYSILRRHLDGSFLEVDPATVFSAGDALRIRFETNQAGSLSVMEQQPDGKFTLRMAAHTEPGQPVYMPSESAFDVKTAGTTAFLVRFSRTLRSEASLDQPAVTPNLLRETAANAVYVVNPAAAADPHVDFEIAVSVR